MKDEIHDGGASEINEAPDLAKLTEAMNHAQDQLHIALEAWCTKRSPAEQLVRLSWQLGAMRCELDSLMLTFSATGGKFDQTLYMLNLLASMVKQTEAICKSGKFSITPDGRVIDIITQ